MMEHLLSDFPEKASVCISTHSKSAFLIEDLGGGNPIVVSEIEGGPVDKAPDNVPHGITVLNPDQLTIEVLAIDKCLIQDHEQTGLGRCEGVMGNNKSICWFEIKKRRNHTEARKKAYQQLENTIKYFRNLPPEWKQFALVALLRRSPSRSSSFNERKLYFLITHGVILLEETHEISFPL